MPQTRIYPNHAERQRAYRARKRNSTKPAAPMPTTNSNPIEFDGILSAVDNLLAAAVARGFFDEATRGASRTARLRALTIWIWHKPR